MSEQPQPAQGAWEPGGFTVPHAYTTAKRIPEDLPFVVRPSKGRMAALFGTMAAVFVLLPLCGIVVGLSSLGLGDDDNRLFLITISLIWVVMFGGSFFAQWLIATSGGPLLAANEHGLWIRARKWPVRAIWLPWNAVGRVYLKRWGMDKAVCVLPHDPRAGSGMGAMAALDMGMQKAFLGAGLTASVKFSDKREAEVMAAIAHFARGRTYIG